MKIDKDGWIINTKGIWVGTIDHINKEIRPNHGYYPDFSRLYQKDWEYCLKKAKELNYAYRVEGLDLTIKSHFNFYKKWRIYYVYTSYQSDANFQKALSELYKNKTQSLLQQNNYGKGN